MLSEHVGGRRAPEEGWGRALPVLRAREGWGQRQQLRSPARGLLLRFGGWETLRGALQEGKEKSGHLSAQLLS